MNINPATGGSNSPIESDGKSLKPKQTNSQTDVGNMIANISSEKDLKRVEREGQDIPISDEQLIKAIQRALKEIQGPHTELHFSVHEKTKQIVVKVMDKDTGEVIREIPPEKNLDFLAKLWEKAGILIDQRV